MINQNELSFVKNHLDFWDYLTDNEKNLLSDNIVRVNYNKGYKIHSSDSECIGVLIVESGQLRTYIISEDGREVTLYRLNPSDVCVMSASCILKSITFDVHIDAEKDTSVYLLNVNIFSKLYNNIYVENFMHKNATEKFSDVMWAMEQILFMKLDERLAIFLYDEITATKSDEIKLTQEQIAKYIGSAREVVSRMLKVFQNEGILELSRGSIRIINKDKLKKIIE